MVFLSHYSSSLGPLLAPDHVLGYDRLVQHFTLGSCLLPDKGSTAISNGYREAQGLGEELGSGPCVSSTPRVAEAWSHPGRAPVPSRTCWARGPSDTLFTSSLLSPHTSSSSTPLCCVSVCECMCRHVSLGVCVCVSVSLCVCTCVWLHMCLCMPASVCV